MNYELIQIKRLDKSYSLVKRILYHFKFWLKKFSFNTVKQRLLGVCFIVSFAYEEILFN